MQIGKLVTFLSLFCIIASCKVESMQPNVYQELFEKHYRTLKHTNIQHKPLCICFSGVPGMGKTHVAKILEDKYQAMRISTDEIRIINKTLTAPIEMADLLESYLAYFFKQYSAPNKLIIIDASIDRVHKNLFAFLKQREIPYIVIRLEVPKEEVIRRLTEREGPNKENYLRLLDSWYNDYELFGKEYTDVYVLNSDKESFSALLKQIESLL